MSKRGNSYGSENRVNILKKIKVGKNWNLYPAVVEPNGKLRDKVRVRGKIEIHPEGFYYIEWWQGGRKLSELVDISSRSTSFKPESSTCDESMDEVTRKTKKGGSTDYQTRHGGTRKVYVQNPFTRTDIDSQSAWVKESCIP